MPRLCPHCHKPGIAMWKALGAGLDPVKCSHCHRMSRRKRDWSMYALLIVPAFVVPATALHIDAGIVIGSMVVLSIFGTHIYYQGATFEPLGGAPPYPETQS